MKRITAITVLTISLILLIISSIDDLTRILADARYKSAAWWGCDKYAYGDLYGFTYLPQFRIANPQGVKHFITQYPKPGTQLGIDLYALTDSYTGEILKDPTLFYNVHQVKEAVSNEKQKINVKLDKSKLNILLLESTERNVRGLFKDTAYLKTFLTFDNSDVPKPGVAASTKSLRVNFKLNDIDANIEFNTWSYRLLSPIKEFKAWVDLRLFNRINSDASLSNDGQYLFYTQTVDPSYSESSFKPIGDKELNELVNTLNYVSNYYRNKGFDEVFISIIPNPVTIIDPNYRGYKYNQLVPRIQNSTNLGFKFIDTYNVFRHTTTKVYCSSDTHWNYSGEKIWLEIFNRQLKRFD